MVRTFLGLPIFIVSNCYEIYSYEKSNDCLVLVDEQSNVVFWGFFYASVCWYSVVLICVSHHFIFFSVIKSNHKAKQKDYFDIFFPSVLAFRILAFSWQFGLACRLVDVVECVNEFHAWQCYRQCNDRL